MIVRDEERTLPACLESVDGLWDELCVVDTGSTDGTIALLEEAGARIEHRTWTGDFSAARNVSLEMATGVWVLVLDADEQISTELKDEILHLLDQEDVGAATLLRRDVLRYGHVHEVSLKRLFRRATNVRYQYAVYEEPTQDLGRYLKQHNLGVAHPRGVIHHAAYSGSQQACEDKLARDCTILENYIARDPNEPYYHYRLLEKAKLANLPDLWSRSAPGAAALLDAMTGESLDALYFGADLALLTAEGLFPDNPQKALQRLSEWVAGRRMRGGFLLKRAVLRESAGDTKGAEEDLNTVLSSQDEMNVHHARVRPLMALARLRLGQGCLEGAADLAWQALQLNTEDREALHCLVALFHLDGGEPAVQGFAKDYRAAFGPSSALQMAVGEHALRQQRFDWAVVELASAAGTPPSGWSAVLLAQALAGLGEHDLSRSVATAVAQHYDEARNLIEDSAQVPGGA